MGVSTATSLIVLSQAQPYGLALQAADQNVPLSAPVSLGGGSDSAGSGLTTFWQVRVQTPDGMLVPSAEQVLTATVQGSTVELTRFTTAAGYDKEQGTPPVLNAFRLWRVRYPVSDIGSGNCVLAEYHGFVTIDYTPGTVPNTLPPSVVHTVPARPPERRQRADVQLHGGHPVPGHRVERRLSAAHRPLATGARSDAALLPDRRRVRRRGHRAAAALQPAAVRRSHAALGHRRAASAGNGRRLRGGRGSPARGRARAVAGGHPGVRAPPADVIG